MAPVARPFDSVDEDGGEFEGLEVGAADHSESAGKAGAAAKEGHATGVGIGTVAGHVTATEQGHKRARVEEPDEAPQVP